MNRTRAGEPARHFAGRTIFRHVGARERTRATVAATAALLALTLLALTLVALPGTAAAQNPAAPVTPIPTDAFATAPDFEGSAAVPKPITGVPQPPRHPFMAPNGRSNLHDDAYQTDTYEVSGPLGDGAEISNFFARECASVTFDSQGRIVTICVGLDRPVLTLMNPTTLQVLAAMQLPPRSAASSSGNPFSDFSGGGYFYLDDQDRAVFATNDRHVLVVGITAAPAFSVVRDYSLTGHVADGDGIISVLPDWSNRLWFVTRTGTVGVISPNGSVKTRKLGEGISNSIAVDETGGVYVVTDRALYRFDADKGGEPGLTWRQPYPNSGVRKPGQSDAGSGTTPTLMGKRWVTITDNADPMNIQVYERGKQLGPSKAQRKKALKKARSKKARKKLKRRWRNLRREVCSQSVFDKGKGSTDQSLIVAGRSIITENNYGYSSPTVTEFGGSTEPGLARVDVVPRKAKKAKKKKKGKGKRSASEAKKKRKKAKTKGFDCKTVWVSQERAPSVVPKLSLGNGLVYTYTKPPQANREDPWYLTALDYRTGATVYRRLAADGLGHNNNFAPVTLGPDGTAYVGVLGGIVRFAP
jgi:hypothetical protein